MGYDSVGAVGEGERLKRIAEYLHEAVVELEVWRQNARTLAERQALQRVTALLSHAANDLRSETASSDPAQQSFRLSAAR